MVNTEDEDVERELYFLIAKFLSKGPCVRAGLALKEELVEHQLLRRRVDWRGEEHDQTYEETVHFYPIYRSCRLRDLKLFLDL